MKNYPKIKMMRVRFHGYVVVLNGEDDRKTTPEGVEIWIQKRKAGEVRPMASIPDGTLDKYKHCRPEWLEAEWED